ncbi:hypothetical protein BDK62_103322 [Halomonas alkaliantarctica]|nr:hypothetical protein BDK62_103322 [Halomonas alkaliantarctica]
MVLKKAVQAAFMWLYASLAPSKQHDECSDSG